MHLIEAGTRALVSNKGGLLVTDNGDMHSSTQIQLQAGIELADKLNTRLTVADWACNEYKWDLAVPNWETTKMKFVSFEKAARAGMLRTHGGVLVIASIYLGSGCFPKTRAALQLGIREASNVIGGPLYVLSPTHIDTYGDPLDMEIAHKHGWVTISSLYNKSGTSQTR